MDSFEPKKKSVPGARDIILQMKAISDSIQSVDAQIRECQEKIDSIISESRTKTVKDQLFADLRTVNEAIQKIREQRKAQYDQLDLMKTSIEKLKESNTKDKDGVFVRKPEDIDKKIELLNMRLISESVSVKDEKQIAADLLALRSMRSKLGDIEENLKLIRNMDASIKDCKASIAELSQQLADKTLQKNNIKVELDKVNVADKVKSPEILKLENRIGMLRTQKQQFMDQKNVKKAAIKELEAEHAKFEEMLAEQQKLEKKKEQIKEAIQQIKTKKDLLLKEIAVFDPKIYDSHIYSISQLKNAKSFSIDIDLVSFLMKNNIKIPRNQPEVDETLALLREKRGGTALSFKDKSGQIMKNISEFDDLIEKEMAKLNEMPPTDIEILKKAGKFRNGPTNKA